MIELRNSTGQLDFARVTPEMIGALDEPHAQALMALMQANETKEAAVARNNAAMRRVNAAIDDEERKRVIAEDAASPIPFSVKALEAQLGRPLTRSEMASAREQHATRVRGVLAQRAHQASIAAFNASRR